MQLKPEILNVLNTLNADQNEIDSLTAYFGNQLTQAEANVAQINNNIISLQTQLTEAQNLVTILVTAISKFVVV